MSLFITSLNSGSNGNCYYIGNEQDAVLIDAGISCRETERRMSRLGLSMSKVRAIFVSHEHSDHIRGIDVLSRKYQVPVYITDGTRIAGRLNFQEHLHKMFVAGTPVQIGELSIMPFSKYHDASDPHSFIVSSNKIVIGIFTDIGRVCDQLIHHFKQCHAAFLETNYDEDLLENGRYPYHLKRRIRGGEGHLSNRQALELFNMHRPAFLSHLFLSHLSRENNNPQLTKELFAGHAGGTEIVVASRDGETAVYRICESFGNVASAAVQLKMEF